MKKLLPICLFCFFSAIVSAQTYCDTISSVLTNFPGSIGSVTYNPGDLVDSLNTNFGLSNGLSYWFTQMLPCGDSCRNIIPCDSIQAAINSLSVYNDSSSGVTYSVPFAEAYLGLHFPAYNNTDHGTLGAILSCCNPSGVNFSDTTLSLCDQIEFMRIYLQYALPNRSCLPAWLYQFFLTQIEYSSEPDVTDSTIYQFNAALSGCKLTTIAYCDDTIISSCDSINSVNFVYRNALAWEGVTIDTTQLDNLYQIMFGYPLPYNMIMAQINNCNKGDSAIFTEITYSARNLNYSDSAGIYYVDFDVFATDTPNNLLFAQSNIFIQYDTTIFGSGIVSRGAITASKGQAIDSPYYNVAISDSTPNLLHLAVTHTASPASLANLDSASQQLCHLRVSLSGFNLTAVAAAFDTIAMHGRSDYQQTPSGLEFPYDEIRISGLVGAVQQTGDSVITYEILNTNYASGYLTFDILVQCTGSLDFYSAEVIVNYNTDVFGSSVVSTSSSPICTRKIKGDDGSNLGGMGGTGTSGGNDIYTMSLSDNSSSAFEVDVTGNGYYDLVNNPNLLAAQIFSFTTLATCSLQVQNCCHTGIYLSEDSNNSTGNYEYVDDSGQNPISTYAPYTSVIANTTYNNNGMGICALATPVVDSISPDCNSAGSFQVLTINGSNFGCDTGTVWFNSADSTGLFVRSYRADILLWTPTQIQLLIPSSPKTAGSGVFYIQTTSGLDNQADGNRINIGYANSNYRNPVDSTAQFIFMQDTTFVFQLDTTLWNTPGVIATVQHVMADMNCQTGVNFQLDTTGPSIANRPNADFINLISIQPETYSKFASNHGALAYTEILNNMGACVNNLSQYNNFSRVLREVDISFRAVPYYGSFTWNWSDANTPTIRQYDFATDLAHELGHAALLDHIQPQTTGGVMYPNESNGEMLRNYDNDPNDILGIYHVLSLGTTLGTACGIGYAVQTFSGSCTQTSPACVPYYPTLGITNISTTPSFSTYLYPNPYQGNTVIHIDVSAYSDFTISIYDIIGHELSEQYISSSIPFDVSLSNFEHSSGLYLIQVSDSHNTIVLKMIKL